MTLRALCVAGARPNFPKVAPLMKAFSANPRFLAKLIHTGQHYDDKLSKVFFEDLRIARPDENLSVGSGSHAVQTAEVMKRFEAVLEREQPHAVIVVGDVNSTIACALVTAKFHLKQPIRFRNETRTRPVMVHVEAGLRSLDWDMPEEINRLLTDVISDLLFVSDPAGLANLKREGISEHRIHYVGNVMIDTLLAAKQQAMTSPILGQIGLTERRYAVLTLHRPSNVDDSNSLRDLFKVLDTIAVDLPIVFPAHPRTRPKLEAMGFPLETSRWIIREPMGYLDFVKLMACSALTITDSGGIQEETTALGVPCLTLRENTERPVTIEEGTNILAGTKRESILSAYETLKKRPMQGRIPKFWDGKAATRIVEIMGALFPAEA
jgi:UDP-N-acetylglucosamine 2-epimerase (non-hydrolysing)